MHMTDKLLLAAGLGRELYGKWQLRRLVSVLTVVLMLAVTSAVMISIFAMGGMYVVYLFLLHQGVTPLMALLAVALIALGIITALFVAINRYLETLRSSAGTVRQTVDAFLDGLFSN